MTALLASKGQQLWMRPNALRCTLADFAFVTA
jgi:hypothetical protein